MSSAASVLRSQIESTLANRFPGALTIRPQFEPEMVSFDTVLQLTSGTYEVKDEG